MADDVTPPVPMEPKPVSPLKVLARGTTWQLIGQIVPLVLNLVLTPYIMEGLGPLYGIFLLVNVIQLFMGALDGGIGPSANRFFTIYAGRDDRESTTSLLVTLLAIVCVTAVVIFGFFFAITPWLIHFFPVTEPDPEGAMLLLRVMVVLVAIAQIRGLFAYVLFAQHKFGITTSMMLLGHLIYAVGVVLTIERGWGLEGIAVTFIVQQAVATVCIIPSALRYLTRTGVRWAGDVLGEFWRYSWKVQLTSVMDVVAMQSDALIVAKAAPTQWKPFGPGSNFAQQLRMVPMNAFSPVQAMVGRAVGGKGADEALHDYHRVQKLWVVGVVGWVMAAAPASYFAVNHWLLAMDSTLPGQAASILLVGHLCYLISVIQIIWCLAIGRSDIELKYGIVALVLNLSLTLALIVPFGAVGSITATVVAQVLASLYLTWLIRHNGLGVRSPWRILPYDAAVLCASLSYLGSWGMSTLVGNLSGGAGLVLVGLGAAPALVVYILVTVGPGEIMRLIRSRRSAA